MAILYLLQRPDVDVLAITVLGTGEAHCDPGVQNAQGLAALAGRPDVPVACGRPTPLAGDHVFPDAWRARADDLVGLSLPANPEAITGESAVQLLSASIQASPGEVVIVALGPLTNLAEAFQGDPSLVDEVGMLCLMGGAFEVPGNIAVADVGIDNAAAEWNIYIDPHAAAMVLASGVPMTIVPLDATSQAPVTEGFVDRLGQARATPAAEFVYQLLTRQIDFVRSGGYFFWDPLTAAIAMDEALGGFEEQRVVVVEGEGPESGATWFDANGSPAWITTQVDGERFETLFLDVLNGRLP
jgi:inosine-uridine nucleoside N-ribohydrolase